MRTLVQILGIAAATACAACGFPRPADVGESSCTAGEFVACEASVARICNAAGDGTVTHDCGAPGCNATAKRCNECAPTTASCNASDHTVLDRCGTDGLP